MSYRKVGGLHFVKFGRFTFMWCRSRKRPTHMAFDTAALLLQD